MPDVNIQNLATKKSEPKEKNAFLVGLYNLWPFNLNLKEYPIWAAIILLFARLIVLLAYSIYFLIKIIVIFVINLCKINKPIKITVITAIIVCVLGIFDFAINYGKVYPGVYVGDIDLGGKTVEEARDLIESNYSYRLSGNNVIIYVDEKSKEAGETDDSASNISEQLNVEQARETVKYWKTNSVELDATLPVGDIVDDAINSNRGIQNIPKRLGALLFKQIIKPYAIYNENAIQQQIERVNDTIGSPLINPSCVIQEGVASPVAGEDGNLINEEEFVAQLNEAFFQKDKSECNFVPRLHVKKQNVSFESAKILAEKLNNVLERNVTFQYKNINWEVDKLNLSKWIKVEVENRQDEDRSGCSCSFNNENYCIAASIDGNIAGSDILSHTREQNEQDVDYSIKFEKSGNDIIVKTNGGFEIPSVIGAVEQLNNNWLENACVYESSRHSLNTQVTGDNNVFVQISSTNIPETLSLSEAINMGAVTTISTYTTAYSSGAGTENRNHNIALGSSLINNTICSSDGGSWSFNKNVGDSSPERGFEEAGAIVGNRYTKSIGGGICQVATTVFNAIYDAGFPIPVRYNHDLHMESYPAGRDAAINYPDLDLVWKNNSNSDVLMQSKTTGYSITVDLIGVNPKYTVKTEQGEWVNGEHYATEYVVDPSKEKDSKFTQTSGSDAKSIIIKRSVYDKNGNLVLTDEFRSNYKSKTEIIVLGPGEEADKMLQEKTARLKNESDNW